MIPTLVADIAALPGWNTPMLLLLAKATLILIAALGVTIAMQRASAGARHLVWLVTLGTLMIVPALAAWSPLRIEILPATAPSTIDLATDPKPAPAVVPNLPAENANVTSPSVSAAAPISITTSDTGIDGVTLLLGIWAAVVLLIAGWLGYGALVVRRIVRNAHPLDTRDWVTPLWEIADRLGLEEPPRLLGSDEAKMPFACGFMNPTIVLPSDCETWSADRRRAVLLHELAHVRRHDLVGHTLGRMACAVYWFHPLVWTAARRLRNESERACDDLALSCGARASDYAEHLLDIVTSVRHDATPAVALAMARRKDFEGRMLAILDPELRHSTPNRRQSMTLIGSLAMMAVVIGAAAPAPRGAQDVEAAAGVSSMTSDPVASITPDAVLPGTDFEDTELAARSGHEQSDIEIPDEKSSPAKAIANAIASSGIGVADAIAQAIPTSTPSREALLGLVKAQ